MILFVNGFNRSGTTVLQEAVAAAMDGTTLTVGDLMRHGSPELATRLRGLLDGPDPVDRGVDAREVTEDMPEEYGWYLLDQPAKKRSALFRPEVAPHLGRLAAEISARSGLAVLKNPPDLGLERTLLRSYPDAKIIITRRAVTGIMDSSIRAMTRSAVHNTYLLALTGDDRWMRFLLWMGRSKAVLPVLRVSTRWSIRLRLLAFLRTVPDLPLESIAFLDYDEMVQDPAEGARWAAHLLEPERLGKEFRTAHSLIGTPRKPARTWLDRRLDRRWERAWAQARDRQVQAGVLHASPAGTTGDITGNATGNATGDATARTAAGAETATADPGI